MRKRSFRVFLLALAIVFLSSTAFASPAAKDLPRVWDKADVLTDAEEVELTEQLDEISKRQKVDVVVATELSSGEKSVVAAAQDFYDYKGYGFGKNHDGIIFYIATDQREFAIQTTGFAIKAFTDSGLDYIKNDVSLYLGNDDYMTAFQSFGTLADKFVQQAKDGEPYDGDNMPTDPADILARAMLSLLVGFLIALFVAKYKKSQMKTILEAEAADDYAEKSNMKLVANSDHFVRKYVTSRKIERDSDGGSSTSVGSSGTSHGGTSGSY